MWLFNRSNGYTSPKAINKYVHAESEAELQKVKFTLEHAMKAQKGSRGT